MLCLGIESTAHTFGIGIAESGGKILANVKDICLPKTGWGLIPAEARAHHQTVAPQLIERALAEAKISLQDIDLFSYSQGPGLPPCLHVGKNVIAKLATENRKPIIPVNHCIAHIEIGLAQTKLEDPVTLYVSGANTQVIAFSGGRYRCFGETQDIGIGNALDKLGRSLNVQFPAGPKIEELAKRGSYFDLPYSVKGMDLSFTGLVTAAERAAKMKPVPDVCHSFQETAYAMLTEVAERAVAYAGKTEVLLTGGVAANQRLQEMVRIMAEERGAEYAVVPKPYAMDNGAMIAWTGLVLSGKGKALTPKTVTIKPRQRTDDIEVTWKD